MEQLQQHVDEQSKLVQGQQKAQTAAEEEISQLFEQLVHQ